MAGTKTRPTRVSVDAYLASRASAEQLADCEVLIAMCKRVTRKPPKMWGPSIVGFGSYTYRYESGRSGEACLYFTRLADLDTKVLEALIAGSVAEVRKRWKAE